MPQKVFKRLLETNEKFKEEFTQFKDSIFFDSPSNSIDVRLLGVLIVNFIAEKHPDLLDDCEPIQFNSGYFGVIGDLSVKLLLQLEKKYFLETDLSEYVGKEVCVIIHNEIGVFKITELISDKTFGLLFGMENIHTEMDYIVPVSYVVNNSIQYEIDGEEIIIKSLKYNTQYGAEVLGRKLNLTRPINFSHKVNFMSRDYRVHYKNIHTILTAQVALTGEELPNFNTLNNLLIKHFF